MTEHEEYNELLSIVSDIVGASHMDQEGLARLRAHLGATPTVATPAAIDALEMALIAECERAMLQRDEFKRTGVSTASHSGSHDTCFGLILRSHGVASTPVEPMKAAGSAVDAFWSGTLSDRNKPA